jgi:hypothetical protein
VCVCRLKSTLSTYTTTSHHSHCLFVCVCVCVCVCVSTRKHTFNLHHNIPSQSLPLCVCVCVDSKAHFQPTPQHPITVSASLCVYVCVCVQVCVCVSTRKHTFNLHHNIPSQSALLNPNLQFQPLFQSHTLFNHNGPHLRAWPGVKVPYCVCQPTRASHHRNCTIAHRHQLLHTRVYIVSVCVHVLCARACVCVHSGCV